MLHSKGHRRTKWEQKPPPADCWAPRTARTTDHQIMLFSNNNTEESKTKKQQEAGKQLLVRLVVCRIIEGEDY